MAKRQTLMDTHMNRVVWFGGLPLRRGDVMTYLGEQARELDKDNWLRIRDAGMLGNYQYNEMHGYPPEGTESLTLAEFKVIIGDTDDKPKSKAKKAKTAKSKRVSSPMSIRGMRG